MKDAIYVWQERGADGRPRYGMFSEPVGSFRGVDTRSIGNQGWLTRKLSDALDDAYSCARADDRLRPVRVLAALPPEDVRPLASGEPIGSALYRRLIQRVGVVD